MKIADGQFCIKQQKKMTCGGLSIGGCFPAGACLPQAGAKNFLDTRRPIILHRLVL